MPGGLYPRHRAGPRPHAGAVSAPRSQELAQAAREVLQDASAPSEAWFRGERQGVVTCVDREMCLFGWFWGIVWMVNVLMLLFFFFCYSYVVVFFIC